MPSKSFENALKNHQWQVALELLRGGEDISEYLEDGNTTLHLAIIQGYAAYRAEIDRVCSALASEPHYPDSAYPEEDMQNDAIVKFIEELLLRGLDLYKEVEFEPFIGRWNTLVKSGKTYDALTKTSPVLGKHLSYFMQSELLCNRARLLTLCDAERRNPGLKELTVPKETNMRIAEMLTGLSILKPKP